MIKGIHHICLKAKNKADMEKTVGFYKDILGFSVKSEWEGGVMLECGGLVLELFDNAETDLPQGVIRHFALKCDNVAETAKNIESAGYKITMRPKDIVIPSVPPVKAEIAFCIGPLGEEIELFDEK